MGQEVKEMAKELGENEGVGFGPGDVVDPIFSGAVDDQGGRTDEGDDLNIDAESESDGEHTYPPPPGTAERQLHDELQFAANKAAMG